MSTKVRLKTFNAGYVPNRSTLAGSLILAAEWIQENREDMDVFDVLSDSDLGVVDVYYHKYKKNQAF